MTELFEHQISGIAFLKEKGRAILADEMGLGKTRQAILAAGEVAEPGQAALVICPASLKINWEREIHAVYPNDRVQIVEGGRAAEAREEFEGDSFAWVVVNYDVIGKHDWILEKVETGSIGTVILDEAHYIKGKTALRTEAALEITESASRVYCLTGTPIMNRPSELFNLLKAVKHPLSKARTIFAKRYCGAQMKTLVQDLATGNRFFVMPERAYPFRAQKDRYRVFTFLDDTGATHLDELRRFTADVILRRTKAEVLDLPEKIISEQYCDLTDEQRRTYDEAWDQYLAWVESNPNTEEKIENIKNAQQLIELGKMKQVCSIAKVGRISEDTENAVEQGQKVIIFTQYKATVAALVAEMRKRKIKAVTLTGADTAQSRDEAVRTFQEDEKVKVFIANMKAGGVGITLTAASIVIFADLDWSPEVNRQAEDRAHRIGQEGTVNVYRYIFRDTVEEEILKILDEKGEIIRGLLG